MPDPKPLSQEMRDDFGKALREYRRAAGMTQVELAAAAPVAETYLSEVEAGKHNIGVDLMAALAKALGKKVTLAWQDAPRPAPRKKKA